MSTSAGTLQPKVHIRPPLVWAVVALFVAATIGVYLLTTSESSEKTATSPTTVSGTAANTPTELRGGILGSAVGTVANTPTELRGGFIEPATAPVVRPFGRAAVIPRVGEITSIANTPSELGTVISFPAATSALAVRSKQLGIDPTVAVPSTAVKVAEARNAMLASYQHAPIAVEIVEARNAMLASYQTGSDEEILVNGEPCAICWKYR